MTTPEKTRRTIKVKRSALPRTVTSRTAAVIEKQARAAELRAAGVEYKKIAEELGYSHASSAKYAVDAFLQKREVELAKDVILLDLVRLDEMQMRLVAAMRTGNLKVIPTILSVMEARYRIAGVSARTVQELQERFGIDVHGGGGGVVNNGVMVIGGSEGDFVRSLMVATGNDPDDPRVIEQVKAIETARTVREQRAGLRELRPEEDHNSHGGVIEEHEVIDAEIVG